MVLRFSLRSRGSKSEEMIIISSIYWPQWNHVCSDSVTPAWLKLAWKSEALNFANTTDVLIFVNNVRIANIVSNIFLHFWFQSENKSHSLLALQKIFFFFFLWKKHYKRSKSYQDHFCNRVPFCNRCGMRVEW